MQMSERDERNGNSPQPRGWGLRGGAPGEAPATLHVWICDDDRSEEERRKIGDERWGRVRGHVSEVTAA